MITCGDYCYPPWQGDKNVPAESCQNCIYCVCPGSPHDATCRRHAPSLNAEGKAIWPKVLRDHWCGDFQGETS